MKNTALISAFIFFISLALNPASAFAQDPCFYNDNFDTASARIYIYPFASNIWQWGQANKTTFTTDSTDKVMITDSVSSYPVNANSWFSITTFYPSQSWCYNGVNVNMWHHVNTTQFKDGGIIEQTIDNGDNWFSAMNNVFTVIDTVQGDTCMPFFNSNWTDTLYNQLSDGTLAFTGNYCGRQLNSNFQFYYFSMVNDTAMIRFRFVSDSIFDNLDGWMIDSISLTPLILEGINEPENNTLSIYPNPATNQLYITTNNTFVLPGLVNIYDITGKQIGSQLINSINEPIDVAKFSSGLYYINMINHRNQKTGAKFLKE